MDGRKRGGKRQRSSFSIETPHPPIAAQWAPPSPSGRGKGGRAAEELLSQRERKGPAPARAWEGEGLRSLRHFQIGLPSPGRPSRDHFSVTVRITSSLMRIGRPHSRLVSPSHLSVASRPILEPRPDTGEAKSR